jgi:quinol monooxygenase YgiN
MIALSLPLTVAPENAEAFEAIMSKLVAETNKEEGVVAYRLARTAEPGHYVMMEIYQDQAAMDSHMASPHFKEAAGQFFPLLTTRPNLVKMDVVP